MTTTHPLLTNNRVSGDMMEGKWTISCVWSTNHTWFSFPHIHTLLVSWECKLSGERWQKQTNTAALRVTSTQQKLIEWGPMAQHHIRCIVMYHSVSCCFIDWTYMFWNYLAPIPFITLPFRISHLKLSIHWNTTSRSHCWYHLQTFNDTKPPAHNMWIQIYKIMSS
jgi:hypothetical protein